MLNIQNINCNLNNKEILKNLSFIAKKGNITGLLGRNGSGKSTIMHCILDLLPLDSGDILYKNKKVNKENIGFVPERNALFQELTGNEFLDFIISVYGNSDKMITKKEKLITYFELEEYINKFIEDYPKGIKQRLSIITAFLNDPEIIVLDEPFSGLDPFSAILLKELLKNEKEKDKIILLSTHIVEIAEVICDNIIVIDKGETILNNSVENIIKEFKSSDKLEEIFLELTGKDEYKNLIKILKNNE